MQVKVNLRDYKQFWQKLCIAVNKYQIADATIVNIIEKEFGFNVVVQTQDNAGTVIMDDTTFTWFELKWS